jgi:hypothetical protein
VYQHDRASRKHFGLFRIYGAQSSNLFGYQKNLYPSDQVLMSELLVVNALDDTTIFGQND